MDAGLRIIFAGEVLDGFDPDAVKRMAAARLNVGQEILDQIFSGRPVVLKKGLNEENGLRYLILLERLGMRARLVPSRGQQPVHVPQPAADDFDPERTQLASPDALRSYSDSFAAPARDEAPAVFAPPSAPARPRLAPVAFAAAARPAAPSVVARPQMQTQPEEDEGPSPTPAKSRLPMPQANHVPAPETMLVNEDGDELAEEQPTPQPMRRYAFWAGAACVLAAAAWLYVSRIA